jgi:subtilisin-like proprotein convertase family protein
MRRTLLLLSTMALSLLLASGMALAATTTFSNTSSISIVDATSAGASPANPYPSEINVQGHSGTISDVNIKLNGFSHGFPDDVAVQVVSPDGTSVLLMSDVGGPLPFGSARGSGINLTLDDEAAISLPDNGQLTTGTYKPTKGTTPFCNAFVDLRCLGWVDNPVPNIWPSPAPALTASATQLSEFDGKDPNGTWKLYVIDDTQIEAGQMAGGWSLEIDTGTSSAEDTAPPRVKDTVPGSNIGGVAPGVNVKATFSEDSEDMDEDMDASTIDPQTFKLFRKGSATKIVATVSYDAATDTATLDPANNLRRGVAYKAVVTTRATDMAGNQLDQNPSLDGLQQKKWFFTTRP